MSRPEKSKSLSNAQFTRIVLNVVLAATLLWILGAASHILLPLILAAVVGIVFAPLADVFDRIGAPPIIAALAVLLIVLSSIAAGIVAFYPVISEVTQRIPLMWVEVQDILHALKAAMEGFEAFQERISEAFTDSDAPDQVADMNAVVPTTQDVLTQVPTVVAQAMIFIGILYFFLLTRSDLYELITRRSYRLSKDVLCAAEAQVSRYFLTITAINAAFGFLVGLMLSAVGMPNVVYWGLAAFLVNFVLYLGPITFAVSLLIAGIIVFDGVMTFVPAILYLAMNISEGQFVTPSLVGRHMKVNPLLVFTSLVTWMWLWGPLGGVIAIPILVWFRQIHKALVADDDRETTHDPAQINGNLTMEARYDPAE